MDVVPFDEPAVQSRPTWLLLRATSDE